MVTFGAGERGLEHAWSLFLMVGSFSLTALSHNPKLQDDFDCQVVQILPPPPLRLVLDVLHGFYKKSPDPFGSQN